MTSGLDLLSQTAMLSQNYPQAPSDLQMQLNLTVQSLRQVIFSTAFSLCRSFDSYQELLSQKIANHPLDALNTKFRVPLVKELARQVFSLECAKQNLLTLTEAQQRELCLLEITISRNPENFLGIARYLHKGHIKNLVHQMSHSLNLQMDSSIPLQLRQQEAEKFLRLQNHAVACTYIFDQRQGFLNKHLQKRLAQNPPRNFTLPADRSSSSSERTSQVVHRQLQGPHHPCVDFTRRVQAPTHLQIPPKNFLRSPISPTKIRKRKTTPLTHSSFSKKIAATTNSAQRVNRISSAEMTDLEISQYLGSLGMGRLQRLSIGDLKKVLNKAYRLSSQLDKKFFTPREHCKKSDEKDFSNLQSQQGRIVHILLKQQNRKNIIKEIDTLRRRIKTAQSEKTLTSRSLLNRRQFQYAKETSLTIANSNS